MSGKESHTGRVHLSSCQPPMQMFLGQSHVPPHEGLLNRPVTSIRWHTAFVLKEQFLCYVNVDTSAVCHVLIHCFGTFILQDICVRVAKCEKYEFFYEMFLTCILYCCAGFGCFISSICNQSICCFLSCRSYLSSSGFSWEAPSLYFEKATRFCTDVLMFLPSS